MAFMSIKLGQGLYNDSTLINIECRSGLSNENKKKSYRYSKFISLGRRPVIISVILRNCRWKYVDYMQIVGKFCLFLHTLQKLKINIFLEME